MAESRGDPPIPILLLKTKSKPTDLYESYFSNSGNGHYRPAFVPVLEHRFKKESLQGLRAQIETGRFRTAGSASSEGGIEYGGVIFTSQRAVEAFSQVVQEIHSQTGAPADFLPPELPLYVVGPATSRGLEALKTRCGLHCPIRGEDTGNGEALASFILRDYRATQADGKRKLPLLFLVGEVRRDIIPKTLQSEDLPEGERIAVHEVEVYETQEAPSFKNNFLEVWGENSRKGLQWVVVFSPTGCKALLEAIGLLDPQSGTLADSPQVRARTRIAAIGPTTRDYMKASFGFEPDACAGKPSPEGVGAAIRGFSAQ